MNNTTQYINDEPCDTDSLNRDDFASALARTAQSCQTPFVVGLYGGWGVGKTSLMRLLENNLDLNKTKPIWFDAWRHQFDENPALGLSHIIAKECNLDEDGKKLLVTIASALGSLLLKSTVGVSATDITKFGEQYEENNFLIREKRVALRDTFEELIKQARGIEKKRLIIFIDDLDRCLPDQVFQVLESLKLYLDVEGCIYVLAVDPSALEQSVSIHYEGMDISASNYLQKIVQLPFIIPPIAPENMESFVKNLIPNTFISCLPLLVKGLGDNPRQIKRFINNLMFYHELAKQVGKITNYKVNILCGLLLIRERNKILFEMITRKPSLFINLTSEDKETFSVYERHLKNDFRLRDVVFSLDIPVDCNISEYIYLAQVSIGDSKGELITSQKISKEDLSDILSQHKQWLSSSGNRGKLADLSGVDLSNMKLSGVNLKQAILIRTDFVNSNLDNTNFSQADLREANFRDASMVSAIFSGANMNGATGLSKSQVSLIVIDNSTTLPDGTQNIS